MQWVWEEWLSLQEYWRDEYWTVVIAIVLIVALFVATIRFYRG